MIIESVENVCLRLSEKNEWLNLTEIARWLKAQGLDNAEMELALEFLKSYLLDLNESGSKARLSICLRDLFRHKSADVP